MVLVTTGVAQIVTFARELVLKAKVTQLCFRVCTFCLWQAAHLLLVEAPSGGPSAELP